MSVVVPLRIVSPVPLGAVVQPVTIGVPIPRGKLTGEELLCLEDETGVTLPVQTEVLARWPDRSVKWLLADFLLDGSLAGRTSWEMRLQETPTPSIPAGLRVRDPDERLEIEAGEFVWSLACDSLALLAPGPDGFLRPEDGTLHVILTDHEGRRLWPRWSRLSIETRGGVRTTVRFDGSFPENQGLRVCARVSFFAGTGLVRVQLTVHNPNAARHPGNLWDLGDRGSVLLGDLSLEWIAGGEPGRLLWKPEVDAPTETTTGQLWQIYQDSSGGANWQSRNHVDRTGESTCHFRGYQLQAMGGKEKGLKGSPVLALCSDAGTQMAAVPEFWQQFPKTLESDGSGLRIGLFPREAKRLFELQGGEQKTHTVWFNFEPEQVTTLEGLDWVHRPARVMASPEWHANSGALPYLLPDEKVDDRFQTLMDEAIRGDKSLLAKREVIDQYGWRNYGDVYADHESAYYQGPPPVISHYNNQFDMVYGAILQQLRTGEVAWSEVLGPLAGHVIDIDIYHTTEDRAAYNGGLFWPTDHYRSAETATHRTYSRANVRPGVPYGGGPCCEHSYTTGLLHYYYLSGDRQALEAVSCLADWVVAMDDGSATIFSLLTDVPTGLASATRSPDYHGPGRGAGNSINTLLDGYQATGRAAYLDKAEQLIRRTIHPHDDIASRDLLNVEAGWSYTMHLVALARYLDLKAEEGELDFMYAYAQASLVHYAQWMVENERPYFDHPDDLEYPTEAWAAQEFRKANVLRLAAKHADEPLRERLLERGRELADRAWTDLLRFESRHVARAIAVLMIEGVRDSYYRVVSEAAAPRPIQTYDFGRPEVFVPQRQQALARMKTLSGVGYVLLRLTNPKTWGRIAGLIRQY